MEKLEQQKILEITAQIEEINSMLMDYKKSWSGCGVRLDADTQQKYETLCMQLRMLEDGYDWDFVEYMSR